METKPKANQPITSSMEEIQHISIGQSCVVVYGDGDQMKIINDTAGKQTTDAILQEVHNSFATFNAPNPVYYCREHETTGDEWVFLFIGTISQAMEFFESINDTLKRRKFQAYTFTLSFTLQQITPKKAEDFYSIKSILSALNVVQKQCIGKGLTKTLDEVAAIDKIQKEQYR